MSVLLYSGGLDAYCISKMYDPTKLLFVDPGTEEAEEEWELVQDHEDDVEYIDLSFLKRYEEDESKIIPLRNTFFVMAGALLDTEVWVGATIGDGVDTDDTTRSWASSVEAALNAYSRAHTEYLVWLPAKSSTKAHLVKKTAEQVKGGYSRILQETKSCHYGTKDEGCGDCFGCLRRWTAFVSNLNHAEYLTEDEILEYFDQNPLAYYDRNKQAVVNNFARRRMEFVSFEDAMKNVGLTIPEPSPGVRTI